MGNQPTTTRTHADTHTWSKLPIAAKWECSKLDHGSIRCPHHTEPHPPYPFPPIV